MKAADDARLRAQVAGEQSEAIAGRVPGALAMRPAAAAS